jgi:hypothetical protein
VVATTVLALSACGGSGKGAVPDNSFLPDETFVPDGTFGPAETFVEEPFVPDTGFVPDQGAQPNGPIGGSGQLLRFTPQVVFDPAAGNIAAMTYLLPDGWQTRAGVQWLPEWVRGSFLQTSVFDPSTGIGIDFLPIQNFIWFQAPAGLEAPIGGNYQGKAYVPPITDPVQFVSQFWMPGALSHLQNARLANVAEVPAIAEEYVRQFGGTAEAHAYRLRYEYQQDGVSWEQDVSFALLFSPTPTITSWFVDFAYTVRAPRGELDRNAGIISTVVASRVTTPEWEGIARLVQQLFYQGIQQQMADTAALGRTLAAHRAESAALQAQVTQERQASQDRIADLRREVLGGVETYNDPVNRVPVQLPVGFNEYWVNERGEYLTSGQAGFNPNTLNDGFWQRLERRG